MPTRRPRRLMTLVVLGALLAAPLVAVTASPSQAMTAPAADVTLVKAMFATGRLTAGSDDMGEPLASLQAYANGTVSSHIVKNERGVAQYNYCTIDHTILQALYEVIVNRGFSLRVTSINRYCERDYSLKPAYYSMHWENGGGHAVDVDKVNGQIVRTDRATALTYINAMFSLMPPKTGLGQLPCWPGVSLPSTWFAVPDNCDSVHIEYRGTDPNWTPPRTSPFDYSSDGVDDFLAVRNDGLLFLNTGNDANGFVPQQVGSGWTTMPNAVHGDFNGDGNGDIVSSDLRGVLWFYPGNGKGGWGVRKQIGSGWQLMGLVSGGVDFNGDGKRDLIARRTDGSLWLYKGSGAGSFPSAQRVGIGWGGIRTLIPGDFNGDGRGDLEAIDSSGNLRFYPGNGAGGWGAMKVIGPGWTTIVDLVTGGADFNGDGLADLLARRTDGTLTLYKGTGTGSFASPVALGPGWGPFIRLL